MNEWFRCKNQEPVDVAAVIFRMKNQKEGDDMDDQERRSYECAKNDVQKLMIQNGTLRDRVGQLEKILGERDDEIRKRNAGGDALARVIQKLTERDLTEVQITFRMKGYYDES